MNGESTVISFEKLQSRRRERAKHSPNRIFVQLGSVFVDGVAQRLARFFDKVDDELFSLSEKADNCVSQARHFGNMRYLRCHRDGVQARCLRELASFYESFWHDRPLPDLAPAAALGELSLLENEILEESLAVNGMVDKGNGLFQKELFALDRRFMALLGRPGQPIEVNPVSPWVLCRLFAAAIAPLNLDLSLKLLIYKIYDNQVLSSMGSVYHEMNARLVKAGVLPALVKTGQARRVRIDEAMAGWQRKKEQGEGMVVGRDAFEAMRHLLEARRSRLGAPGPEPKDGALVVNTSDVLGALGVLSRHSLEMPENGGILSGEQMKRLIACQIGGARADGKEPLLDRQAEDVIDMVGMIFAYIFQDSHLPASVKAMLANLQLPILRVALLEKSFFDKKNHPARLLLNSLAQAGMALDAGMEADSPVYQKIAAVVARIVEGWDRNADLFYELLEDFTAFMAIEHRRNRAAEERTRQATQSKEQIRRAKRAVAHVIASKLRGTDPPTVLKSFLCNAWKDVLVLAWLRRGKDAEDWGGAVGLMDQLIEDMASLPARDASQPQKLAGHLLFGAIKNRLEVLAYDRHWTMELLRELEICHEARAQGLLIHSGDSHEIPWWESVGIEDADFAALLREIEEGLRKEGASREGEGGAPRLHADVEDEFLSQACSLGIGQWVEFTEAACGTRRAKLSWKSHESDAHIFVNAKGVKVVEMSLADLVRCFRLGAAKVIEDASIPLMDRALSRLRQALENPACACVP
jgi:hypothetical protein